MRRLYRFGPDAFPRLRYEHIVNLDSLLKEDGQRLARFMEEIVETPRLQGYWVVGSGLQDGFERESRQYTIALLLWSMAESDGLAPSCLPSFRDSDIDAYFDEWPADDASEQAIAMAKGCLQPKMGPWLSAMAAAAKKGSTAALFFRMGIMTLITGSTLQAERGEGS